MPLSLRRLIPLASVAALLAACADDPAGPLPVASVEVTASADSVSLGGTLQLSASTLDGSGAQLAGRAVEWSSDNPAIARVDSSGLVTALAPGAAKITARSEAREGSFAIRVVHVPVHEVTLNFVILRVLPGQSVQLSAWAFDAAWKPISGLPVAWATADSTLATISSTGRLTSVRGGVVGVSATIGGVTKVLRVEIHTTGVHVWPDTASLLLGSARRLLARAVDQDGFAGALYGASWTSSDPSVARVDTTGQVTAVALGRATITATIAGQRHSSEVYVTTYAKAMRFATVSSGRTHSCAVTPEGDAFCWGSNALGQLGTTQATSRCESLAPLGRGGWSRNTFRCSALPVQVEGGIRFASVAVGDMHSCGLTPEGRAYCWGDNGEGALGRGTSAPGSVNPVPAPVAGGITFRSLSAGSGFTCGVSTAGEGFCWGGNHAGALGNGGNTLSPVPVKVAGGLSFASLETGFAHSCGIATDGGTYCWGRNTAGELGTGTTPRDSNVPVRVAGAIQFTALSAGTFFTCGLDAAGRAHCWGEGGRGQLGTGGRTSSTAPVPVADGHVYAGIVAGARACGILADGRTLCWGDHLVPYPVQNVPEFRVRTLSLGGDASCAIAQDGLTYCTGARFLGQTGAGSFDGQVSGPQKV
ncbi:MAG: hypothetical protein AVDCRST_MAG89-749, partial [uncultured Gemmatimonadetes bacterium]